MSQPIAGEVAHPDGSGSFSRHHRAQDLPPHATRGSLDVQGTTVSGYLPAYFGSRRLVFDATRCAVADTGQLPDEGAVERPDHSDVLFEHAISLPYLFTTGPLHLAQPAGDQRGRPHPPDPQGP